MISLLSFWESYITNPTLLRIATNPYLLFAIGLVLLIKGGDWFVDGASGIAKRYHVPELLIGATVVSIGTTLPEVMVSSGAAFKGVGDIAYGNAIGSVICNTALIAAITVAVKPSKTERKTLILPVVSFFLAAAVYCVAAYGTGQFSRLIGIVLLAMFVVYMALTIRQAVVGMRNAPAAGVSGSIDASAQDAKEAADVGMVDEGTTGTKEAGNAGGENKQKTSEESTAKEHSLPLLLVLIVVGAALIAVGADLLVDNATIIAKNFGVSDAMIALTVIALGTSLPELVTAITSLIKGHGSLSLGNVIGANLFNLVLVSGMAVTICPFGLPAGKTIAGINSSLIVDIPVMLFVMAVLTIPAIIRGKLSRFQGILLLATYVGFTAFQIVFSLCF